MDYKFHYHNLIERARFRSLSTYTETHHIVPRCLGGSDDLNNLVELTPEEHYIAHQLLVKIHPDNNKLIFAAKMMVMNRPGNKLYGWLRRKFKEEISKQSSGVNNSQFGSIWITNGVVSKKHALINHIPSGWREGRIIKQQHEKVFNPTKSNCQTCGKEIHSNGYYKIMFCNDHKYDIKKNLKIKQTPKATEQDILTAVSKFCNLDEAAKSLGYKNGYSGNVKYRFDKIIEKNKPA